SNAVNMPGYFEASNDLYYGPPVISQPIASPPLDSKNISSNTQSDSSLQNSDALKRCTGNNDGHS
ncbi:MAG: hypothetical protein N0E48_11615, partial [Candidatus Thiodiazotropha endolucinida]|nr:hypothetical protein [Candidatus Thiodiazotropha taylori]MCW4343989.1 hypothetical protein [Candidatus Thiodiazotropha endolucinida]